MLHENDIYNDNMWWRNYTKMRFTMQICGGGMSNSWNELFVCNPFDYIPSKNIER